MTGSCELCGRWASLEKHHVFGAANRKHSERWGMVVYICPTCHRTGENAVHRNREAADRLKAKYQEKFEIEHPDESFLAIFGRLYR